MPHWVLRQSWKRTAIVLRGDRRGQGGFRGSEDYHSRLPRQVQLKSPQDACSPMIFNYWSHQSHQSPSNCFSTINCPFSRYYSSSKDRSISIKGQHSFSISSSSNRENPRNPEPSLRSSPILIITLRTATFWIRPLLPQNCFPAA